MHHLIGQLASIALALFLTAAGLVFDAGILAAVGAALLAFAGLGWLAGKVIVPNQLKSGLAPEEWMPLYEAFHHLVYDSKWAERQSKVSGSMEFDELVIPEVRERLARGEIASRGKRGLDRSSLDRATEAIDPVFWIDAFFQPHGEIALADPERCAVMKEGGGGACFRGVILRRVDVMRTWPKGGSSKPPPLATAVDDVRRKIAAELRSTPGSNIPLSRSISSGD